MWVNVKPLKISNYCFLKYATQFRTISTLTKTSHIRRVKMALYLQKLWCQCRCAAWTYRHDRIIFIIININCGTFFVFWDFSFKVNNNAWIMPSFSKWFIFIILWPVGFKMKYPDKLKNFVFKVFICKIPVSEF